MARIRRSKRSESTRSVDRLQRMSAICFLSAISCSTILGFQSFRSRPSNKGSSCSLTSCVSIVSKNCCRDFFFAEACSSIFVFFNWSSAFRYILCSFVPLACPITLYVSRMDLDRLSRNTLSYMTWDGFLRLPTWDAVSPTGACVSTKQLV